jgi:hypothetical protein
MRSWKPSRADDDADRVGHQGKKAHALLEQLSESADEQQPPPRGCRAAGRGNPGRSDSLATPVPGGVQRLDGDARAVAHRRAGRHLLLDLLAPLPLGPAERAGVDQGLSGSGMSGGGMSGGVFTGRRGAGHVVVDRGYIHDFATLGVPLDLASSRRRRSKRGSADPWAWRLVGQRAVQRSVQPH